MHLFYGLTKCAEANAEEPSGFAASDFGSFIFLAAWLSLGR